jgi:hypothetical protein
MLRRCVIFAVAGCTLVLSVGAYRQGQTGTAAEAKAMREKAVTAARLVTVAATGHLPTAPTPPSGTRPPIGRGPERAMLATDADC